MYINRDNGVEERGADTGLRARGNDDIVVQGTKVYLFVLYLRKSSNRQAQG